MQAFTTLRGVAVPMLEDDINTDQITPVGNGPRINQDYAELLFMRRRRLDDGALDPDFVLNKPEFQNPAILVARRNFGCGSSRESAVWALIAVGIRCVVARSFADIYRENCLQNGLLPIVLSDADAEKFEGIVVASNGAGDFSVDLMAQTIAAPTGDIFHFDISPAERLRLLEGLDDIGLTLKHAPDIAAYEARIGDEFPWQQRADIATIE
jgi:3-isopropylmalate/(R)-2-methylmalate dehydratase small subunit